MFNDIVENLRLLVGLHGAQGCSLEVAATALSSVILPRYRLVNNVTVGASVFELLRTDSHISCVVHRPISASVKVSDAPEDWPHQMWLNVSLQKSLLLVPSRALQAHSCGVPAGIFMRPTMWATLDALGQHLLRGASRETIKAACGSPAGASNSNYYLSVRDLKAEQIMVACAVVVPGVGFRERYFLRVANPSVGSDATHGFPTDWLQRMRSLTPASPATSDDELGGAEERDGASSRIGNTKVEPLDDEDVPIGVSVPLRALQHRRAAPSAPPVAVEDDIIVQSVHAVGGAMLLRQLTTHLLRFYGLPIPEIKKRIAVSSAAVGAQCQVLSSLRVVEGTSDNRTIICTVSRLPDFIRQTTSKSETDGSMINDEHTSGSAIKEEDNEGEERTRVGGQQQSGDDDLSSTAISIDPLLPLSMQLLELARHRAVLVEHVRPAVCARSMKHLIPRMRAAAATPAYANAVEFRMQRASDRKTFCVEIGPSASSLSATSSTRGISQWARDVFLEALTHSTDGILVLETLSEILDRRTLQRLIPVLRAEGRILTTGVQLENRRNRVGLILDVNKLPSITEERKLEAAERYFASMMRSKLRKLRTPKTSLIPQQASGASAPLPVGGSTKHTSSSASKLRATFVAVANGAAPNHTARCWRLHLEMWNVWLRLQATRRLTPHALGAGGRMLTLRELVDEMSLSTFCVVCGVNSIDLEQMAPSNGAPLPWGCAIRQLPDVLRDVCQAHSTYALMVAIGSLQACGAVQTDLPLVALPPSKRAHDLSCRIVLAPTITTADGQSWQIYSNHPTALVANVGLFWGLGRVEKPFTATATCGSRRHRSVCDAIQGVAPAFPSLAETFALSFILRGHFASVAHLAIRARGDASQLCVRCDDISREGPVPQKCHRVVNTAVRMILRNVNDDEADASKRDEDEEATENAESDLDADARKRIGKKRVRAPCARTDRLEDALRVAVADDACFGVLRAMLRIFMNINNEPAWALISHVLTVLEHLHRAVAAHLPSLGVAQMRSLRGWALQTILRPCEVNECDAMGLHDLVKRHVCSLDESASQAKELLRAQADLVGVIQSIVFSRWDALSTETRDALLEPFDPTIIPAVCRSLKEVFPHSYAKPKTFVSPESIAFLRSRLNSLIVAARNPSHMDRAFSAHNLAENIVAHQAHALVKDVVSGVAHANAVDGPPGDLQGPEDVWSQLVQQPVGTANDVALYVTKLKFPSTWEDAVNTSRKCFLDFQAPASNKDVEPPTESRLRDPPAWSFQPCSGNGIDPPFIEGPAPPAPSWMKSSALCNGNGTMNMTMVFAEVSKVRSMLMKRPGMMWSRVVDALVADGIICDAAASSLVNLLISDGCIVVKGCGPHSRHPLSGRRIVVPLKRPREGDEEMGCRRMLWWNLERPDTVLAPPLQVVLGGPAGGPRRRFPFTQNAEPRALDERL